MRLFIAEKPSLGRAIAMAIGGNQKKEKNCIYCGDNDVVAWSRGHILRLKEPREYNPEYQRWENVPYPYCPDQWQYVKREDALELLSSIEELLRSADEVINAGDADREGQRLIDELIEYFKYGGPVLRLLVTDTSASAIRKAIGAMRPNQEYQGLSSASKARAMADWLLGFNMTMLHTVEAQKQGYHGTPISVGRVQTPVLGLIVQRDKAIESFQSKIYYQFIVSFKHDTEDPFSAKWLPQEGTPGLDDANRLIDQGEAIALEKRFNEAIESGEKGIVQSLEKKPKKIAPPLTYSLPALQIEASQKYNMSPSTTLAIVQNLYEGGIVTYPRSDCPYLPMTIHASAKKVAGNIQERVASLKEVVDYSDFTRVSAAFNDTKVAEHFAIVPTGRGATDMSEDQQKIYDLIALRFLLQFLPDHEYMETRAQISFAEESFGLTGREITIDGWKSFIKEPDKQKSDESDDEVSNIPTIDKGDPLVAMEVKNKECKTTPPRRFTEASLLQAMNKIHLFVEDGEVRKILKENDGIGTAATQAAIIEKIITRNYVSKDEKNLTSTVKGRNLIDLLTDDLIKPDRTALWEQEMKKIAEGSIDLESFIGEVKKQVAALVAYVKNHPQGIKFAPEDTYFTRGEISVPCFKCNAPMRRVNGKDGYFWACTSGDCKTTFSDKDGKPQKPINCPRCKKVLKKKNGKFGPFWVCTCGLILDDEGGKPQKTSKCKVCSNGLARRKKSKTTENYYWLCIDCGKIFSDDNEKKTKIKK